MHPPLNPPLVQWFLPQPNNPNTIKSYKILQKLSPKHAAHGVVQSIYPIYRHGKACLSKQPPWRAAGDPRLTRGRSRVRAPPPAGALHALFFSTLPSFLLPSHQPCKSVRVKIKMLTFLKLCNQYVYTGFCYRFPNAFYKLQGLTPTIKLDCFYFVLFYCTNTPMNSFYW